MNSILYIRHLLVWRVTSCRAGAELWREIELYVTFDLIGKAVMTSSWKLSEQVDTEAEMTDEFHVSSSHLLTQRRAGSPVSTVEETVH